MARRLSQPQYVFCVAATLVLLAAPAFTARAQSHDDESPIHALARAVGLAAEPPPPADFVRDSRPTAPLASIPVFSPPVEPTSTVRSDADVKATGAELDKTVKAHDKIRASAPTPPTPAAKADAKRKTAKPMNPKPKTQAAADN